LFDAKVSAIIGIAVLLGLSGYFGVSQYQQTSQLQQDKSALEQQNSVLNSYAQNLNYSLDESISKAQKYETRIEELTQDVGYYQTQANIANYQSQTLEQALSASISPPYTLIEDRNVIWIFEDSQRNRYEWKMPIDAYRSMIETPEPQDMKYLESDDGPNFSVRDYTKFIDSGFFEKVIDDLYDNAGSDKQFLYEVWFVTSQLTTYSPDIGDDPRWALETFTEAGGDCEDLTILIASMLKASSHTNDWTIEIVYFDADSPDNPYDLNHVALFVKTDNFQTYVESTAKVDGLHSWESVNGWHFEV
jgi:hypothetical protein